MDIKQLVNRRTFLVAMTIAAVIYKIKASTYPPLVPAELLSQDIKDRILVLLMESLQNKGQDVRLEEADLLLGVLAENVTMNRILEYHEREKNIKRKKRFIFNFETSPTAKNKWSTDANGKTVTIPYGFDDVYEPSEKVNVRKAMDEIERETCIRFTERSIAGPRNSSFVAFKIGLSCISFVGKTTDVIPQPIYLSYFCRNTVGYIIHEILHTVGLWHTHQRQDRNDYVRYIEDNAEPKERAQFLIIPASVSKTYGLRYDLASMMQFSGQQFSIDNQPVLETLDTLSQKTIGQRVELSFQDGWLINTEYCKGSCSNTITCLERGYQDPNNCAICKCPDGYAGDDCSVLAPYKGETCGGIVIASQEANIIQSPNYGTGNSYKDNQECTWKIQLPQGTEGQIEFWFEGDMGIYCLQKSCFHWVELRYGVDLTQLGPRFCCNDYLINTDNRGHSTGTQMLVLFRAKSFAQTHSAERTGFKLRYKAVNFNKCPTSKVCPPGQRCNPNNGSCEPCPSGYTGQDCLTDINECDGDPCLNGGTCVNTAGSYYCQCVGFEGLNCETNTDDCIQKPCLNGGTCIDGINDYKCVCTDKYEGKNCGTLITTTTTSTSTTTTTASTTTTTIPSTTTTKSTTNPPTTTTTKSTTTPSSTSTFSSTTTTTKEPTTTTSTTTSSTSSSSSTTTSTTTTTSPTTTTKSTTTTSSDFTCPQGKWKVEGMNYCCDNADGGPPTPVGYLGPACLIQNTCKYIQVTSEHCRNTGGWWRRHKHCELRHRYVHKCLPTIQACQPGYEKVICFWDRFGSNQPSIPVYSCAKEGWTDWSEPFCCYHNCGKCPTGVDVHRKWEWRVDGNRYYVRYSDMCERISPAGTHK